MRLEVHKFGGTSVGNGARMRAVAELIATTARSTRLVVVTSATAGTTDRLAAMAAAAGCGEREAALGILQAIGASHEALLKDLAPEGDPSTHDDVHRILAELTELAGATAIVGAIAPRTKDRILAAGEKLAARLLACAARARGVSATALDADTFLETDDRFGEAAALPGVAERTMQAALSPALDRGEVPIVTGFIGRSPDGATTVLGRGGSDLSATLIAAAIGADEVTIWTDVDGVFSADPGVVPEARTIRQLNFREAAEMSYYGAKVLHQRTMIPVAARGIPVRTRNTFDPEKDGTIVDGRVTPGSHPVKAVTAVRAQALVSIEGRGMAGVPGVAERVFRALARRRISVTMISQSSSESSICLAVPEGEAVTTETELKREFRADLSRGEIDEISVRRGVGLVAAVGLGMAHTPGIAARVFAALASRRLNVLAIAQGSSELNISLAVDDAETGEAVRALHAEFELDRLDTGEDTTRRLDILLLGWGKIGRALTSLLLDRDAHFFERFGLTPRVVAIADSSAWIFRPNGFTAEELRGLIASKSDGRSLTSRDDAWSGGGTAMVRHALSYRLARPILVDVTGSDESPAAFLEAFRAGCDVVTANKKPLAGALATFHELVGAASEKRRRLRAEATVGAGLPVMDTLEMLLSTGDRLVAAEGCLSGTLGHLMTQLEAGQRFSQAVAEAARLGYTEPDPVADLTGHDVARKAVILGRLSGLAESAVEIEPEGLVDPALAGLPLAGLIEKLAAYDVPLADRVARARASGLALRYMARVTPGRVEVGPREVPIDSPAGRLHGTDNMIVFTSERYRARPLVVMGPGAGVEVTAMGVLGDILRIAAERR
jgi:aspartokinase/homoserine dehydrogenase 1